MTSKFNRSRKRQEVQTSSMIPYGDQGILYWVSPTGALISNHDFRYLSSSQQEQCEPVKKQSYMNEQMKKTHDDFKQKMAASVFQGARTPCPNCKEVVNNCACMRNKCCKCGEPVGNVTFTVCDDCWTMPNLPELKCNHG